MTAANGTRVSRELPVQRRGEDVADLAPRRRLLELVVHAAGAGAGDDLLAEERADEDEPRAVLPRVGVHPGADLQPVEPGHLEVEQRDVRLVLADRLQRGGP